MFDKTTKDREVTGRERNIGDAGSGILSIISKEMHIEGNCETNGQLLIEGKISGNVIAQSIDVASSGSVDGDIIAAEKSESDHVFIVSAAVWSPAPSKLLRSKYEVAARYAAESLRTRQSSTGRCTGES